MKVVLKLSKNNSLTNTLNASVNKTLLLLLLSRNKHIHTQERGMDGVLTIVLKFKLDHPV